MPKAVQLIVYIWRQTSPRYNSMTELNAYPSSPLYENVYTNTTKEN